MALFIVLALWCGAAFVALAIGGPGVALRDRKEAPHGIDMFL